MKENNDNYDFLSNEDFEQWENDFPKLPKMEVSFPHKHKLYKFEKRKKPQWVWYAAAACFVLGVFVFLPRVEREEAVLIAEVVEIIENGELRIENEIEKIDVENIVPLITKMENETLKQENEFVSIDNDDENSQFSILNFPLNIAMLQPITDITGSNLVASTPLSHQSLLSHRSLSGAETTTSHPATPHLAPESILQERLELALNDFVITPARTVIHNVARRFFERRTEVELFLEEQEFPRFFARQQP